jgi:hypothetical protein
MYAQILICKKKLISSKRIITLLKTVPSATVDYFNEMLQFCITVYKQPHQLLVNIKYVHIFKQCMIDLRAFNFYWHYLASETSASGLR